MSKTITVTLGETEYTMQRFRGLKAIMAMAALTRVAREVPDIMADAVKNYQRRNTVVVTEAMARLPRWEGFTKEDFDKAAELNDGRREIELPVPMTQNEQMMYSLPELLTKARKEVVRLLALLIIPNSELIEADREDAVEGALDKYTEDILYNAELDQLVDMCFAAQDILTDQLADRMDRLGELAKKLWSGFRRNQTPSPLSSTETSQLLSPEASTPQTLSEDVPISSTDSETHTDGQESKLSMVSPG